MICEWYGSVKRWFNRFVIDGIFRDSVYHWLSWTRVLIPPTRYLSDSSFTSPLVRINRDLERGEEKGAHLPFLPFNSDSLWSNEKEIRLSSSSSKTYNICSARFGFGKLDASNRPLFRTTVNSWVSRKGNGKRVSVTLSTLSLLSSSTLSFLPPVLFLFPYRVPGHLARETIKRFILSCLASPLCSLAPFQPASTCASRFTITRELRSSVLCLFSFFFHHVPSFLSTTLAVFTLRRLVCNRKVRSANGRYVRRERWLVTRCCHRVGNSI